MSGLAVGSSRRATSHNESLCAAGIPQLCLVTECRSRRTGGTGSAYPTFGLVRLLTAVMATQPPVALVSVMLMLEAGGHGPLASGLVMLFRTSDASSHHRAGS
jgi:hypothetical protein